MNTSYTFKKSAFEKIQHWELTDNGLSFKQEGKTDALIPYQYISTIRMQYKPFRYRTYNYSCIISTGTSSVELFSTSYEGFADFSDLRETYTPFVKELVKTVQENNPNCIIQVGQTSSVFFGTLALNIFLLFVLLGLVYFIPIQGNMSIVIKLVLVGYYFFYVVKSFKKNKPKQATSSEIPSEVLPSF